MFDTHDTLFDALVKFLCLRRYQLQRTLVGVVVAYGAAVTGLVVTFVDGLGNPTVAVSLFTVAFLLLFSVAKPE